MRSNPLCRAVAAAGMAVAFLTSPGAADEERTLTTPTAWWWYHSLTETDLNDFTDAEGARVIDIEVQDTSPLRFAAVFVHNSGVHARNWWWYHSQTAASVANLLAVHNARLIDIERYFDPGVGAERLAVVMVENTGAAAKAWWWYPNVSVATLDANAANNNARLVDVDRVASNGNYDGIMISNTGADASGWWHLYNVDVPFLETFMTTNSARILELDLRDTAAGLFDAILIPNTGPDAIHWWWYSGVTEAQLNELLAQNGARVTDVETWVDGPTRRFAAVTVNNSNALTTRIADILQYGADGSTGLYLKEVTGQTLASLQQGFVFEPASSIKVTHHLHVMRRVMMGLDDLNSPVTYSNRYSGSCPIGGPPFVNTNLAGALRNMMWFSDNAATQYIGTTYGVTNINNTSTTIALMTNTSINHPLGCGGAAITSPNTMTLQDAGMLYERVANEIILDAPTRATFYDLMQSDDTPAASQWWLTINVRDMIEEEAANLGTPQVAASYWAHTELAWKPGGYTLNGQDFVSVAGWLKLPRCDGRSGLGFREYVFGVFVHDAASDNGRVFAAAPELLRDQIRDGLRTCPTSTPDMTVVAAPRLVMLQNAPNPFNPSTTLAFSMPTSGHVQLTIHDVRGREIAVVLDEPRAAGTHRVTWNGRDADGSMVASGAYFARVVVGDQVDGRKIMLAK